ncbi:hypothetical protein ACVWXO_007677 [Bradyrhizobium sp. LM2.7]
MLPIDTPKFLDRLRSGGLGLNLEPIRRLGLQNLFRRVAYSKATHSRLARCVRVQIELANGSTHISVYTSYARRISLSEAARRRLRLPASAMPSSSPLSAVQVPEKPIPTS